MKGVNKVILVGNLGQPPEVKKLDSGKKYAKLSIATASSVKKDGEWQEKTEWHRVVLWDGLADIADKYLKKGSRVYIEGRLETFVKEDGDEKKYYTSVVANDIVMLDSAPPKEEKKFQATDDDIPF